jgi:hypothetical protein
VPVSDDRLDSRHVVANVRLIFILSRHEGLIDLRSIEIDLLRESTAVEGWINDISELCGLIHLLSVNGYKQRETCILIGESPFLHVFC